MGTLIPVFCSQHFCHINIQYRCDAQLLVDCKVQISCQFYIDLILSLVEVRIRCTNWF